MNLVELSDYTRDLAGVYAKDVVSDTLLYRWVNEAYFELARRQTWPWLPVATLVDTPTPTSPAFDAEFHQVLSYRAAIKVLRFTHDDTPRSEAYTQEYNSLVSDMENQYLSGLATGTSATLIQMVRLVRDMTGIYDKDVVSDAVVKVYLNNAYNEVARLRDWDWLENTESMAMPAFVSGVHTVNLTNGTRRILEAYVVDPDGSSADPILERPSLLDIGVNDSRAFYDVTSGGVVTVSPQQDATFLLKFRYTRANVNMGDSDGPLFADQFDMILVFRAAMSVLSQVQADDGRISLYGEEYSSLLDGLVTYYELDHNTTSIQLGSDGLRPLRYYPWFKPAP